MASSEKDSMYSSDEEKLHPRRRKKQQNVISTSDTDGDESDYEIRPRRLKKRKHFDSDSDVSVIHGNSPAQNSGSDNEQAEKCAICLSKFLGQDIATPESCDHVFCLECLQQWAKNVNTCPIDRLKFNLILIRHHKEEKIIKTLVINNSELPYCSDVEAEYTAMVQEAEYCGLCGEEGASLRCRHCSKLYHENCIISLLGSSTPRSWQCPSCDHFIDIRELYTGVLRSSLYGALHNLQTQVHDIRTQSRRRMEHFLGTRLRQDYIYQRSILRTLLSTSESSEEENNPALSFIQKTMHKSRLTTKRRNHIFRARNQAFVSAAATANAEMRSHYNADSDEGYNDLSTLSSTPPAQENFDLVGSILQSQSLLHCPDVLTLSRDGTVLRNSSAASSPTQPSTLQVADENGLIFSNNFPLLNDITVSPLAAQAAVKERPSNPSQNASKYSEIPIQPHTYSSPDGTLERGYSYNENVLSRTSLASNNDEFNNDPCLPILSKTFCNSSSAHEDAKKDGRTTKGAHPSEDEVDIYSDIESLGDGEEGPLNDHHPNEQMKMAFKSNDDVAQLSNNDGSDSSDNDLVIDEDMQVEEEGKTEQHNSGLKSSANSYKSEEECEYSDDVNSDKVEAASMEPEKASCSFGENSSDNCYNVGNESSQDAFPYVEEDNDSKSKTAENHDSENDECLPKSDIEYNVFSNAEDNDSQSKITDHKVHGSDNDECLPKSDIECDEDSVDSSKRSNQGDMFSSAKSSPKSCKEDTNDGFDSTYENHVSNKESGSHQKNSLKNEKHEGSYACENTCDSEFRAEDNSNLELDSYSEHNKDVSSIGSDENVQTGTKSVNFDFTSQNTSCDGSEDMAPESARNSEKQDLIDICQDIVMKSDEEDNFDSTENASTPCLDEPMDGHIENSPREQEDSENFSGTSPNTPDEGANSIYNENSTLDNRSQYMDGQDLDVEDVSEAESDILKDEVTLHTENDVEGLEQDVDSPRPDSENHSSNKQASDCHSPSNTSDQEEGEIVEERPVHKCSTKKREKSSKEEEYGPKINISDLPRIPKLNRDRGKEAVPASALSDTKRTSVLSRVDLGTNDINWKRPSKHTKERSYRDGRPKDEKLMFRERESRNKDRHTTESSRRSDKNNERKRDEKRKQDNEKYKNDSSHSRKSSKTKSSDYSYSDRDKRKSHKDKHLKDKYPKEKEKDKHDKRKHSKESERMKGKDDLRYGREIHYSREERFERYDKSKTKDKEHKSKYKERKTEKKDNSKSGKDHSRDKHKRSYSEDHISEKQKDREVRKIDDKLKIVVEQKDTRKEKVKHKERQDLKHEKKPIIQRKLISDNSYSDVTSIESKEIFAKGDSIIINVNFNRATSPKVNSVSDTADVPLKDKKVVSEDIEFDKKPSTVSSKSKSKHGVSDRNRTPVDSCKRPSTPAEKNLPVLSVSESYWQGGDDSDANNSPVSEKSEELDPAEENETSSPPGYDIENCSMSSSSSDVNAMQSSPKDPTSDLDEASPHSEKDTSNKDGENFNSNRRSPPSPPSPADNDSYDPCEPTRSPSPQPPPLPTSNPKPPPSPELPPLPPEPEPIDIQEGGVKTIPSADFVVSSAAMVSSASQPVTVHTQTSSPLMLQNMLPPPSFLSQVSSIAKSMASLVPSQSGTFPINTHATVMIPSNHVHHQVMVGFMPPHMHVSTALPPPPNPPNMPRIGSVPPPPPPPAAMTLLSHQHLNVQPTLTPNTLLQTLTMAHAVNAPPLQLVHHLPPNLSGILSNHQVTLAQNQSAMSILSQQNSRILMPQNPSLHNHGVMFHNQNVCNTTKLPTENSDSAKQDTLHKQAEKPVKQMTPNDKYEVIDMDVDTPYSPGDSPSVESGGGGYSPQTSPLPSSPRERDSAFDTLFGGDSRTPEKRPYDAVSSTEKAKPSSKKSKHEQKLDTRHTEKIQGKDKHKKSRKDLKAADKKELAGKFEDSQLKILDELPSSAVEMQVKEKFLKKLNRQERVVEEVKIILKPYYKSKDVTKEEYKDILRRAVPKICHNKSGDINPVKVKHLVESYVKKAKHSRKRRKKFS